MKKEIVIFAICILVAAAVHMLGCRDRVVSRPGVEPTATSIPPSPTITITMTPVSTWVIDDCESNTDTNLLGGKWSTYDDRYSITTTAHSVVWPDGFDGFTMSSPGYPSTGYAARLTGTVVTSGDIAMITMLTGTACTSIDVTGYTGVQFYCKGTIGSSKIIMPYINTSCARADAYGSYQATFTVPTDWALVQVPFSTLARPYTGGDNPTIEMLKQHATEIDWATATSPITSVDLWVDDIELY